MWIVEPGLRRASFVEFRVMKTTHTHACFRTPLLELCGAMLLAQLMQKTMECLRLAADNVYFWTDSTIVLSWINSEPKTWNTFVANRVSEIQKLTNPSNWKHVKSAENPADILSRGCTSEELLSCDLWWSGPEWLKYSASEWHEEGYNSRREDMPERRKIVAGLVKSNIKPINYEKYSSYSRLIRIVAYCKRFTKNCRMASEQRTSGPLTCKELCNATFIIVKAVQEECFNTEIRQLKKSEPLNAFSRLLCLNPFIDEDGIVRVGGRLRKANLEFSAKHQILAKHHVTDLILRYEHVKQLHAGVAGTLAALRDRYWPLSAKSTVCRIIRKCLICFRCNPRGS